MSDINVVDCAYACYHEGCPDYGNGKKELGGRAGRVAGAMHGAQPECIAANVIRVLEDPDLSIAKRARTLVESKFTFDNVVERWGKTLKVICNDW
jgi:hypothetical protein